MQIVLLDETAVYRESTHRPVLTRHGVANQPEEHPEVLLLGLLDPPSLSCNTITSSASSDATIAASPASIAAKI